MVGVLSRSLRSGTPIPSAETPSIRGLLTLAVGVVVVAGLYLGRDVLIPITLAVLLSFVLAPLADLQRVHVGRIPSVLLTVAIALGMIAALGGLIGTQVAGIVDDVPRYEATIRQKVKTLRILTIDQISTLTGNALQSAQQPDHRASQKPVLANTAPVRKSQELTPTPTDMPPLPQSPLALAEQIVAPALSPLATAGIIFIVAIFVLLQREDLRDRLIRLAGSSDLHRTTMAMDDAARRLSRYFLTQLGINAAFGLIIGTGLFFIGIPSPTLWGVLAALLRFVPYVGSPMAALLPMALGAAIDPGWAKLIWVAALFMVVEPIMGQAVEPVLYGNSTGLSPVSVIVGAIFWAWLWGPIGLLLSTPLSLCLVVLGRHIERLEFLDVILGDRPALTPVENFYQRALAGDANEAEEQATHLLKDRALSSYYDEVALQGLRLAATDIRRGVLTEVQLERIHEVIVELVEDLDGYDDVDPAPGGDRNEVIAPPNVERILPRMSAPATTVPEPADRPLEWRGSYPVLCIAGRGPLDESASILLSQLLEKHGLGTRVISSDAISPSTIGQLDPSGVAMACVSYLNSSGTMAPLRHLLRRLRERLPGVPILVGLWSPGEPVSGVDRQRAVGATHCATSLRDAVTICLETLRSAGAAEGLPVAPSLGVGAMHPVEGLKMLPESKYATG
jgi:predicted PurR-regulated permease PerM